MFCESLQFEPYVLFSPIAIGPLDLSLLSAFLFLVRIPLFQLEDFISDRCDAM